MTHMLTIMVVDDEANMRKMIRTFLEAENYQVIEASDGTDALTQLKSVQPDLMIIDIMMPFMDGFTLAKEIKNAYDIPFIFLSAKGEEWDKVQGLKLGGDDYIVKPFMPMELMARIEVVLRRFQEKSEKIKQVEVGPLLINEEAKEVRLNNKKINLTRKEYNLLKLLVENKNRVYDREQLLAIIWGEDYLSSERTVDTHIKTLRIKLGEHGHLIQTVWGVGYKFDA